MEETKKTILLIEDDTALKFALSDTLKIEGYQVTEAANGEEGLNTALSTHPELIIADLLMPKMNGIDMLKRLRADDWGIKVPVIILSNLDSQDQKAACEEYHVVAYLAKAESSLEQIVAKVEQNLS